MTKVQAKIRGRKAKIVATIGPGSRAPDTVRQLAQAGADVFRLNFSHGTHEDHAKSFAAIRAAETATGRPLAILADLQGPKIRIGKFSDPDGIRLRMGGIYKLVPGNISEADDTIAVPHPEILKQLEIGDEILLNDGMLQLIVETVEPDLTVKSPLPGKLTERKGFTVRGKALPVSAMTGKDREDLAYALELGVDLVALSFVQRAEDIAEAQEMIQHRVPLIAKLEKPAAIENLREIVDVSDAVMVARGDLGVEYPPEEVPNIQRKIVRAARRAGRPVIVATQMLESMVEHAAPTRAEASDVATAIYQGSDAVMLSAETAVGRHPATAVAIMNRIILATERADDYQQALDQFSGEVTQDEPIDVIARSVIALAEADDASCIALRTGSISRLARFTRIRGSQPIVYGSVVKSRLRQSQLLWGVSPYHLLEEFRTDWHEHLTRCAGLEAPVAYARWSGGEDCFAWEIGTDREI